MKTSDLRAKIHCPFCTRVVDGLARAVAGRGCPRLQVTPDQVCSRCNAPLDSGYVLELLPERIQTTRADS